MFRNASAVAPWLGAPGILVLLLCSRAGLFSCLVPGYADLWQFDLRSIVFPHLVPIAKFNCCARYVYHQNWRKRRTGASLRFLSRWLVTFLGQRRKGVRFLGFSADKFVFLFIHLVLILLIECRCLVYFTLCNSVLIPWTEWLEIYFFVSNIWPDIVWMLQTSRTFKAFWGGHCCKCVLPLLVSLCTIY